MKRHTILASHMYNEGLISKIYATKELIQLSNNNSNKKPQTFPPLGAKQVYMCLGLGV